MATRRDRRIAAFIPPAPPPHLDQAATPLPPRTAAAEDQPPEIIPGPISIETGTLPGAEARAEAGSFAPAAQNAPPAAGGFIISPTIYSSGPGGTVTVANSV